MIPSLFWGIGESLTHNWGGVAFFTGSIIFLIQLHDKNIRENCINLYVTTLLTPLERSY